MPEPRTVLAGFLRRGSRAAIPFMAVCCVVCAQVYYPPKEVRIGNLPAVTAKSNRGVDVLAAALEIVLRNPDVCCGKNSALEDSIQRPHPRSLKDVSTRLQGRHLLSDGRPVMVTADYLPAANVNPGNLIGPLTDKQALIMDWNLHLYVVCGLIFDTSYSPEGGRTDSILKIFLLDPRFSDQRREVFFDRKTEDWGKVQGLLIVKASAP